MKRVLGIISGCLLMLLSGCLLPTINKFYADIDFERDGSYSTSYTYGVNVEVDYSDADSIDIDGMNDYYDGENYDTYLGSYTSEKISIKWEYDNEILPFIPSGADDYIDLKVTVDVYNSGNYINSYSEYITVYDGDWPEYEVDPSGITQIY